MNESLQAHELSPVGGSWTGLLFENAVAERPLALTWTFTIDFAEVRRDFGSVSPSVTIDWVPLPASDWLTMQGHQATCSAFGQPIETSIYYFDHHRYENVELIVSNQSKETIDIQATIAGDIDGLGLPTISTEARLKFAGIYVQTDQVGTSVVAARAQLADFTDTSGLRPSARGRNVVFEIE